MFKKKTSTPKLTLPQVLEIAQCSGEKQFVKKFFNVQNIKSILMDCGFNIDDNDIEITYDESLKVGKKTNYPDVLVYAEDQVFYFEVMSKANEGGWDDDHHEQLILKKQTLELNNDEVHAFAVSFKEFEMEYQPLFIKVPNFYGLHLVFDENKEYEVNVIGLENKIKTKSKNKSPQYDYCAKWSKILVDNGQMTEQNPNWLAYSGTDITYNGTKKGVELLFKRDTQKLGIKLNGDLYARQNFKWIIDNTQEFLKQLNTVSGITFEPSKGAKDKTFIFDFDIEDTSDENINKLKEVIKTFSQVTKIR